MRRRIRGAHRFGDKRFAAIGRMSRKGDDIIARDAESLQQSLHRILRTEFASGIADKKMVEQVPDVFGDLDVAQHIAEASDVLLKNNGVLPLNTASLKNIAVIGSHADVGILTGGGSAQVDPPGGNAIANDQGAVNLGQAGIFARGAIWWRGGG